MTFADRLSGLIDQRGPICAGLDPREEQMPPFRFGGEWGRRLRWGRDVVPLLVDKVAALKPQLAFWNDDWKNVEIIMNEITDEESRPIVIADCKRGDIGSTAKAYADSIFGRTWVDAITVNPYLGEDSLRPFVDAAEEHDRGIFVLVQTSNPGAQDFQVRSTRSGWSVAEKVADLVRRLGAKLPESKCGRTRVGAVVGLTCPPTEVRILRDLMPDSFFLMPGYGAQGGNTETLEVALDHRRGGVLVSASRSLTLPWTGQAPGNWRELIVNALDHMQEDLGGK